MHFKLAQLEVFKAVMETGSISAAAVRLNRTQPAVSVALSKFEDETGIALFDRTRGRFVPTPEAELLFEEVERGLMGIERIVSAARRLREGGAGHLRVAADGAASLNFLPGVIADFLRREPDVRVDLHTRSSRQIVSWVGERQIDVGIVEMPAHWPGVIVEPFSQVCVCIMPEGHPLAYRTSVTPRDLARYPVVSILEKHPIDAQLEAAFADAGCSLNSSVRGYYFAICRSLVGRGAGLAIVDAINGDDALGGGIVSRPFEPTIRYDLAIVYASLPAPSPLISTFLNTVRDGLRPYRMSEV